MKLQGVTIWQKSDFNGFFGLFTNIVTNILVLTGLLLYVVKMPQQLVFGRILPAVGLGIFLSSSFYFYQGFRMAKARGTDTVTALPSGISVPHMFLVIFMIVLPTSQKTGNPLLAWQAGMAWCFIEGVIECGGAVFGKMIRRVVPRAALLGSLAGVSITYIMGNGALQSFEAAYISFACFAVILLGFVAKKKMPFGIPAGLVAIVLGTILGWISGYMRPAELQAAISSIGFYPPLPAPGELIAGFKEAAPFILSAIPMGIYNFIESIDNLESAEVAGDKYDTTVVLLADGITSMTSALFGNLVPTAIYIGHPGWKSIGARLGYSWLTGLSILLISIFGIESILISVIPIVAILPILIYIGILIGSQAFAHVPEKHYPAVILGLMPWLADWGKTIMANAVTSAGGDLSKTSYETLAQNGVYMKGFEVLGNGAIVIGVIWATLLVYLIDRKQKEAIILTLIAAVLTFFGIIHSTGVGIGQSLEVCSGYLLIALVILALYRLEFEKE